MNKFKTVDDYIDQAAEAAQPLLQQIRQIIKSTVPEADEKISYAMPYYSYHGRLIYFAGFKNHIGVYVMSAAREALKDELKPYHVAKATLHFPLDRPLPIALIKKIVRVQAQANDHRQ